MVNRQVRFVLSALAAAACAVLAPGTASAQLVISPLRQVVTKSAPEATYVITNPSDRIVDAKISWVDLAATETGYQAASPDLRSKLSAAPYLVLSPARLRIEPGKRATVTIRLKDGAAIPPGERRSHLLIESTPVRTPLRRAGGGLEVDVGLGVTTPVILRAGLQQPVVSFTGTKLLRDDKGLLEIETTLTRTGRYSSFGRMLAIMTYKGKTTTIGEVDNVAIHVDASGRRISIPFAREQLPAGDLTLRYVGDSEFKGDIFAEKKFEIAPPQ